MQEGENPEEFLSTVDLGRFPGESIQMWQGLKGLMQEGAVLSDIDLGNIPPKSDITATEISSVQQSTSAIIRSVAATVERTLLDPVLDLVWQTALQHIDLFRPEELALAVGPEVAMALLDMPAAARLKLISGPYTFKARGLTSMLDRADQVRRISSLFGLISQMPEVGQMIFTKYDMSKVPDMIIESFGFSSADLGTGARTPEEMAARAQEQQMEEERMAEQEGGGGAPAGPPKGEGQ